MASLLALSYNRIVKPPIDLVPQLKSTAEKLGCDRSLNIYVCSPAILLHSNIHTSMQHIGNNALLMANNQPDSSLVPYYTSGRLFGSISNIKLELHCAIVRSDQPLVASSVKLNTRLSLSCKCPPLEQSHCLLLINL